MSAAERKARLLAKAHSQKPLGHNQLVALEQQTPAQQAQQQQPSQHNQHQQQHTVEQNAHGEDETVPAAAASSDQSSSVSVPAATAAAPGAHGFPAYSDDMDDMDATLYIDQDSDRMQLKNKTQLAQQHLQHLQTPHSHNHPHRSHRFGAPQSPPPQHRLGDVGEDDVQTFQQLTPSVTPTASRAPIGAGDFSPSSTGQQHHLQPVAVLDSAAEERRLDALKAKKERMRTRVGVAVDADAEHSPSPEPSPPRAAAAAAAAAAPAAAPVPGSAGWVDSMRLQQVQVRAAPQRAHPAHSDEDEEGGGGGAAQATQQATLQEDLESDQPYHQRAMQQHMQQHMQQLQQQQAEAAAAAAAAAATVNAGATTGATDQQAAAYQQQLRLQAELAQQTQIRLERGELSPEEQRAAAMRLKRPPLILPWQKLDPVSFFTSALPRGGWLQCRLVKRGGGFASFLHPRYELYTEEAQGGLFLAAARKSSKTKPNYHLSTDRSAKADSGDKVIGKDTPGYAGKVAATLSRSDYVVYDSGFNPARGSSSPGNAAGASPREELGHISYKPHLSGKTPRKLAVLLPILFPESHKDSFVGSEFPNEFLSSSLAYQHLWRALQDAQQRARVPRAWLCLLNKPPRYHADSGQYVLDFAGRAPCVSVKNFQLVYPEEPDEVLFQLGRIDEDTFSVDFRFPIAPQQAFAIALSSLDYKWTVD